MAQELKFKKLQMENLVLLKYKFLSRHKWFDWDYYTFVIDQMSNKNFYNNIEILKNKEYAKELIAIEEIYKRKIEEEEEEEEIIDNEEIELLIKAEDIIDSKISFFNLRKFEGEDKDPEKEDKEIKYNKIFKEEPEKDKRKDQDIKKFFTKVKEQSEEYAIKILNEPPKKKVIINGNFILALIEKLRNKKIDIDWIDLWIKIDDIKFKNDLDNLIKEKIRFEERKYSCKEKDWLIFMGNISRYDNEELLKKVELLGELLKETNIQLKNLKIESKLKYEFNKMKNKEKIIFKLKEIEKNLALKIYDEIEYNLFEKEDILSKEENKHYIFWNPLKLTKEGWARFYDKDNRKFTDFDMKEIRAYEDIIISEEFNEWKKNEENKLIEEKKDLDEKEFEKENIDIIKDIKINKVDLGKNKEIESKILEIDKSIQETLLETKKLRESMEEKFKEDLEQIENERIMINENWEKKNKEEEMIIKRKDKLDWGLGHLYNRFNLYIERFRLNYEANKIDNISNIKNNQSPFESFNNSINELKNWIVDRKEDKRIINRWDKLKVDKERIYYKSIIDQDVKELRKKIDYLELRIKEITDEREQWKLIANKEKQLNKKWKEIEEKTKEKEEKEKKEKDKEMEGKKEIIEDKGDRLKQIKEENEIRKKKENKEDIIELIEEKINKNQILIDKEIIRKYKDFRFKLENEYKYKIWLMNGQNINNDKEIKNMEIISKAFWYNNKFLNKNIEIEILKDEINKETIKDRLDNIKKIKKENYNWKLNGKMWNILRINNGIFNTIKNVDLKIYKLDNEKLESLFWNILEKKNIKEKIIRTEFRESSQIDNKNIIIDKDYFKEEENIIMIKSNYIKNQNIYIEINEEQKKRNKIKILNNDIIKLYSLKFRDLFKWQIIWNLYYSPDTWKIKINDWSFGNWNIKFDMESYSYKINNENNIMILKANNKYLKNNNLLEEYRNNNDNIDEFKIIKDNKEDNNIELGYNYKEKYIEELIIKDNLKKFKKNLIENIRKKWNINQKYNKEMKKYIWNNQWKKEIINNYLYISMNQSIECTDNYYMENKLSYLYESIGKILKLEKIWQYETRTKIKFNRNNIINIGENIIGNQKIWNKYFINYKIINNDIKNRYIEKIYNWNKEKFIRLIENNKYRLKQIEILNIYLGKNNINILENIFEWFKQQKNIENNIKEIINKNEKIKDIIKNLKEKMKKNNKDENNIEFKEEIDEKNLEEIIKKMEERKEENNIIKYLKENLKKINEEKIYKQSKEWLEENNNNEFNQIWKNKEIYKLNKLMFYWLKKKTKWEIYKNIDIEYIRKNLKDIIEVILIIIFSYFKNMVIIKKEDHIRIIWVKNDKSSKNNLKNVCIGILKNNNLTEDYYEKAIQLEYKTKILEEKELEKMNLENIENIMKLWNIINIGKDEIIEKDIKEGVEEIKNYMKNIIKKNINSKIYYELEINIEKCLEDIILKKNLEKQIEKELIENHEDKIVWLNIMDKIQKFINNIQNIISSTIKFDDEEIFDKIYDDEDKIMKIDILRKIKISRILREKITDPLIMIKSNVKFERIKKDLDQIDKKKFREIFYDEENIKDIDDDEIQEENINEEKINKEDSKEKEKEIEIKENLEDLMIDSNEEEDTNK